MKENNVDQKERVEAPVQEQVIKTKKPFYKKKGFWAAMIVGAAALIGGGYAYMRSAGKGENSPTSGEVEETPRQQEHRDREDRGNRDWRRHGNERNNSNN